MFGYYTFPRSALLPFTFLLATFVRRMLLNAKTSALLNLHLNNKRTELLFFCVQLPEPLEG